MGGTRKIAADPGRGYCRLQPAHRRGSFVTGWREGQYPVGGVVPAKKALPAQSI